MCVLYVYVSLYACIMYFMIKGYVCTFGFRVFKQESIITPLAACQSIVPIMPCATCGRWIQGEWIDWHMQSDQLFVPPDVHWVSSNPRWTQHWVQWQRGGPPPREWPWFSKVSWFYCSDCTHRKVQLELENFRQERLRETMAANSAWPVVPAPTINTARHPILGHPRQRPTMLAIKEESDSEIIDV